MSLSLNIPLITDPVYSPPTSYGFIDRRMLRLINDPRDLPFMHFMLEATFIIMPLAAAIFLGWIPWFIAVLYVPLNVFFYMDRFILILHNSSHRPLFRKKYRNLNLYIVWVLGPLFGESPEIYFAHHIGMHHVEENLKEDLSSTMPYQRDSFGSWFKYFLRFFFATDLNILRYMARKNRRKLLMRTLIGEVGFIIFIAVACVINWQAALIVFIIPFAFCRGAMIAGNWGQHAFIDPARPDDPFASSINVINCRYNRRSFNDGYHIGHHRQSTMHWTDLPVEFQKNIELYSEREAIVFSGIDFIMVWMLLMCKRYDKLVIHFVELQSPARSTDEVILLLKSRTRMIERRVTQLHAQV